MKDFSSHYITVDGPITTPVVHFKHQNYSSDILAFHTNNGIFYRYNLTTKKMMPVQKTTTDSFTGSEYFVTKNKTPLMAIASVNKTDYVSDRGVLYFYNLGDTNPAITLNFGQPIFSLPTYFATKNGHEWLAVGADDGTMYLVDLHVRPEQREVNP